LILWIPLLVAAFKTKGQSAIAAAWITSWLFVSASVTLFVSFFADSIGLLRHTLLSIELFRLAFWLALLFVINIATTSGQGNA
jgi:hypothetical protein